MLFKRAVGHSTFKGVLVSKSDSSNSAVQPVLGLRIFGCIFSEWSMDGVELNSTPSIRQREEILFEKVESPGQNKISSVCGCYNRFDWYSKFGAKLATDRCGS
jgi:hypothetical protein